MIVRWLFTLFSFAGAGVGAAWLLDTVLFQVSHDYVYAPGFCHRRLWPWTMVAAAFSSAVVTHIRGASQIRLLAWLWTLAGSLLAAISMAIIIAGMAGLFAKITGQYEAPAAIAPPARVVFCEWLIHGTTIGAVGGVLIFLSLIEWQANRKILALSPDLSLNQVPPNRVHPNGRSGTESP